MLKKTRTWLKDNWKALGIGVTCGVAIGIAGTLLSTEFLTYDGGGWAKFDDDLYIYDTAVAEKVKENLNLIERLNVYRVTAEALAQFAEMAPDNTCEVKME